MKAKAQNILLISNTKYVSLQLIWRSPIDSVSSEAVNHSPVQEWSPNIRFADMGADCKKIDGFTALKRPCSALEELDRTLA